MMQPIERLHPHNKVIPNSLPDVGGSSHEPIDSPLPDSRIQSASQGIDRDPSYPQERTDWAHFPTRVENYDDGEGAKGKRLWINGFEVMSSWEQPIEERTMRELFRRTHIHRPRILIGGEGLGYATRTALEEARSRGGANILIFELHPKIIQYGRQRAHAFLQTLSPRQRATINIQFVEGDFKELIKELPDNSIDAARIDLYPLSDDEKDVDSFVHMNEVVRTLKPDGVVAPFIGYAETPTQQQLSYTQDGSGNERFANRNYDWVWVRAPKDCTYFQGEKMVIGFWSKPIKQMEENTPVTLWG